MILDAAVQTKAKPRAKADPGDLLQIGAPIPGMISTLVVSVGAKVTVIPSLSRTTRLIPPGNTS